MDERAHREYRWLERGLGEPVLLLHGLMGQMEHWDAVLDALAPSCGAMALAMPIFDPALAEPSVRELAAHVHRFLDALEIPRAVVGGNSLGGHVAIELALSWPERVSGLIISGSSGLLERNPPLDPARRVGAAAVRARMEQVFYDTSHVTDRWVAGVRELLASRVYAVRVLRFARDARHRNVADRLGDLRVPALVVWGIHDRITPPAMAERFRELIPGAELQFLARCGHAPMLEQPGPFAAEVAAWLARTRQARRIPAPWARSAR